MLLFFEPTVVAKMNVTLLQSPLSLYLMLIYERLTQQGTNVFATLQHRIEGKEDNKNIKVDFLCYFRCCLGLQFDPKESFRRPAVCRRYI